MTKPFVFKTQLSLVMMTGIKATDVKELRDALQNVPESSVYYHTHHFLEQHQFLVQEPPNDFAYWVTHVLNESRIGERLAAVDTVSFHSLEELRQALLNAIGPLMNERYATHKSPPEQEFHFLKAILFDLNTPHTAHTLEEFAQALKKVSLHSLYYHMFQARLRMAQPSNDFSVWLDSIGETELARQIGRLDPYSQTMEGLRSRILRLIEKRLSWVSHATAH